MTRTLPLALTAVLLSFIAARAETPSEAVDALFQVRLHAGSPLSDDKILRLSKKIADEYGTAVIAPIMVKLKDWKDEEVLYFVPLLTQLPPKKSVPILVRYYLHGKPWEKTCANDLLTEIDMNIQEQHRMSDRARKRLFAGWDGI